MKLSFAERLCVAYLKLATPHKSRGGEYLPANNPLKTFRKRFSRFDEKIANKRIIDFGCGHGNQSLALAELGASYVLGVEVQLDRLQRAESRRQDSPYRDRINFVAKLGENDAANYDIALSLNSFEHFADPAGVLLEIHRALVRGGKLMIAFGPVWFSAYGPHQMEVSLSPWPHMLFPEKVYMKARGHILGDNSMKTYADRFLNKMSVRRFEKIVAASPFTCDYVRYNCSFGLNALARVPLIRELFVNQIVAELTK